MPDTLEALLVDDDANSDYIQRIIKTARPLGLHIRAIDAGDVVSAVIRYSPEVLIVDAKMKDNPRQLARRAVRRKPELAIFFWTGFSGDEEFRDLGTSLNPLIHCTVGVKVPQADKSVEVLNSSLLAPIRALVARTETDDITPMPSVLEAKSAIFHMSVDAFNSLDLDQARKLIAEAQREAAGLVTHVFNHSEAEWLLVAGANLDVIRWGASLANMPDSQRMVELGRRFGRTPLLFTRPMEVDEVSTPLPPRGWYECPPGDYYPCLGIDFAGDPSNTHQIHFDTGAQKTFLSYERLRTTSIMGAVNPIDIRPGLIHAKQVQYIDRIIELVLSDGAESVALKVRASVVFDWDSGPLSRPCQHGSCPGSQQISGTSRWSCSRREVGLLGRDVLTEGRLQIVLDGAERRTRFVSRREPEGPRLGRPWRDD